MKFTHISRQTNHQMHVVFLTAFLMLPSLALAQWESNVRLTYNDSTSQLCFSTARCCAASGDNIHIVWEDWRNGGSVNVDPYYIRSTDRGVTWQPEMQLTNNSSNQGFPSIAAYGSTVHAVWSDYRDTYLGHEIYYKCSTDNGASWGPDIRLTFDADTLDKYRPAIAVSGTIVHVAYETIGFGPREHIFYVRSTDNGTTWSTPVQVSSSVACNKYKASIAVWNSDVHIAWNDDRYGTNFEIYYAHSLDGGVTWSPETRLTQADDYSVEPCLAVLGSSVHVAWGDQRIPGNMEVFYKYSTDKGVSWSQDIRLTNSNQGDGCPSIAVSGSNIHIAFVSWRTGHQEVFYKNSTDNGVTWSSDTRFTFDDNASSHPCVALSDSFTYVVWYDGQGVTWPNFEIWFKRNPNGNMDINEATANRYLVQDRGFRVLPNPFAPFTSVQGHEQEYFYLFDATGRQVGLYKGDKIGWDLGAGIYFLMPEDRNLQPVRIVKVR